MFRQNVKSHNKNVWRLVIILLIISLTEVLSYYYSIGKLSDAILRLFIASTFLLFSFSTSKFPSNNYRIYFLFVFAIMVTLSFSNTTQTTPKLTLIAIGSMMVSGTISRKFELTLLNSIFIILAIIFSILFLLQVVNFEFDIDRLLRRGYTWTNIFAFANLLSIWPLLLFSSYLTNKGLKIAITFWFLAIFANLLFLKRAIIVDSFIALCVLFYASLRIGKIKKAQYFKVIIPICLVILIFGYFFKENDIKIVKEAMQTRFSESSNDLSEFDRFVESRNYLIHDASTFDIVFGKGFLSTFNFKLTNSDVRERYHLHVGWFNWILKGGILLFIGIILAYVKVFKIFFHLRKYPLEVQFAAMFCTYSFFSLFYINMMGFVPNLFFFFYCLMVITDYKESYGYNCVARQ